MSYASLSPELVHSDQFPNFFRTVPSAMSLVHIVHAVMDQYGWKRLAVISEEEKLFTLVSQRVNLVWQKEKESVLERVRIGERGEDEATMAIQGMGGGI